MLCKFKQTLALLLIGSMLLFSLPTTVFAEDGIEGFTQEAMETNEEPIEISVETDDTEEPATAEIMETTADLSDAEANAIVAADAEFDADTAVDADAVPTISLIWDLGASKFNSGAMTVNEDNTEIDVSLNANATQTATLQMRYSMNGARDAEPGEIEIRLPMYIFTTRTGANTGGYQLNLQENRPQGNTGFYYTIDTATKEIVITNFNVIGGGEAFICQVDYTFIPSSVRDGYSNMDITAVYTMRGGEPVESNPLSIITRTSVAPPRSLTKTATKFERWQASWGNNPDMGSSDYYYIVWTVALSTGAGTQPYEINFVDEQTDGALIGSSRYHAGAFSPGGSTGLSGSLTQTTTFRYFLVKYPRSEISEKAKVTNKVTASLTGEDNDSGTPDHIVTAAGEYTYTLLAFNYTGDSFSVSKTKAYPFGNNFNLAAGLSDKLLTGTDEDIVTVKLIGGSNYPYSYSMSANARGYSLTLDGDAGNPDNYGKKTYTTELIDDLLFLKDKQLKPGDYSIASCYITLDEYNYVPNDTTGAYGEKISADYGTYGAVELFYKTAGSSGWVSAGLIRRTGTYAYVSSVPGAPAIINSGNQIVLPDGTSEVKFVHQGSKYKIIMNAYITVELHSTAHVREILQSQSSCDLYNVCTLLVRDANETIRNYAGENTVTGTTELKKMVIERDKDLYSAVVQHGTDKIPMETLKPRTEIRKTAGSHTDNGYVQSLVYTIAMYEYCYYGSANISADEMISLGIVKEQTEGTFYDLLPKGTAADSILVKTYNTEGNSQVCEVDYHTVADWQGSGRTMLIVRAKAPQSERNYCVTPFAWVGYNTLYSGFTLTYRLTNSYFNIVDNGIKTTNLAAYRSATGSLGNGTAAPLSPVEFKYYQKLEGDERDDGNRDTVYAYCAYDFTKPTAALYGIFKQVKAAGGYGFGDEAEVFAAGGYMYQLRYGNSSTAGKAANLVMYDVLEELGVWRGALDSVDTSFAESKGIKPVVYYATVKGLNPQGNDEHADLSNASVWSATRPQGDITAIAVDLRYKNDGSSYEISPNETIYCQVNMTAPADARELQGNLAVNKVSYRLDYFLGGVTTKTTGLSKETKVSLREPDIAIVKSSNPESGTGIDEPAAIGRGDALEYTVSVKNNESAAVTDLEITDTLSDRLTPDFDGLKYYFGTDPGSARLIAGSDQVSARRDGQTLTFSVKELPAGGRISFIIPTRVDRDAPDGINIINVSAVTKFNNKAFTLESNKTYHKVNINDNPNGGGSGGGGGEDPPPVEPPAETAKPPVKPTEPPKGTTEPPAKPTGPQAETAEPPAESTRPPISGDKDGGLNGDDNSKGQVYNEFPPLGNLPETGDPGYPFHLVILMGFSLVGLVSSLRLTRRNKSEK